jgi:hypothetical protein
MLTADVEEAIDRTRPPHNPPARPDQSSVTGLRLRLDLEEPRKPLIEDGAKVADWQSDPEGTIRPPGLEQEDPAASTHQPVGEHAAGGARADDDVIPAVSHHNLALSPLPYS